MAYRYPFPPYPDGWFQIGRSDDVARGQVVPLHYFGRDLVMFRSASGEVGVLDAHCPHMGAHLGHGGTVDGELLRCPFHRWGWTREGRCADVPYAEHGRLPNAEIGRWHVAETAGLILAWHHHAGEPPSWHMPDIPEYYATDWVGYANRDWTIRMHAQELSENVPDSAHFEYVHGAPVSVSDTKIDGPVYRQTTTLKMMDANFYQTLYGVGLIWLKTETLPQNYFLTAPTPIDEERCHVRVSLLLHEPGGQISDDVFAQRSEQMFGAIDQDVPIWENKMYPTQPRLHEADGPIAGLRRWARQFYDPESLGA